MKGLNKFIRANVPETLIDYFDLVLVLSVAGLICFKLLPIYLQRKMKQRISRKWNNSPKDVVILHTTPRGTSAPCISPFALKLETFLRMAKIPYQFDDEFPMGAKGKTPWITLNGKHMADSQLIIQFLTKKFDVKLGDYNETEKAYGRATRIMIDEHMYWGGVVWRFSHCDPQVLEKMYSPLINRFNWLIRKLVWRSVVSRFNKMAWAQGMGRHSYEEVTAMMTDSLFTLSKIIGDKKFLLGEEPSEDDAAVFGLMAQALYSSPGAPFHDAFDKCPNVVQYVERMKGRYWSDWNELLAK